MPEGLCHRWTLTCIDSQATNQQTQTPDHHDATHVAPLRPPWRRPPLQPRQRLLAQLPPPSPDRGLSPSLRAVRAAARRRVPAPSAGHDLGARRRRHPGGGRRGGGHGEGPGSKRRCGTGVAVGRRRRVSHPRQGDRARAAHRP